MKLKHVNKDYTMYEYTSQYVFEALGQTDNLEIKLKTPFGHFTPEVVRTLSKYNIEVTLLDKNERGCVYQIIRKIEGSDQDERDPFADT